MWSCPVIGSLVVFLYVLKKKVRIRTKNYVFSLSSLFHYLNVFIYLFSLEQYFLSLYYLFPSILISFFWMYFHFACFLLSFHSGILLFWGVFNWFLHNFQLHFPSLLTALLLFPTVFLMFFLLYFFSLFIFLVVPFFLEPSFLCVFPSYHPGFWRHLSSFLASSLSSLFVLCFSIFVLPFFQPSFIPFLYFLFY